MYYSDITSCKEFRGGKKCTCFSIWGTPIITKLDIYDNSRNANTSRMEWQAAYQSQYQLSNQ